MPERAPSPMSVPKIETANLSHLALGEKPLIGGVYTQADAMADIEIAAIKSSGENINYFTSEKNSEKHISAGEKTYIISTCDSGNKFSEGYANCTGVIVVATDRETGEQISMLTHQDPTRFLAQYRENFTQDVSQALSSIRARAVPGTLDATIFGGHFGYDFSQRQQYKDSIKTLAALSKQALGFEPRVLTGPNSSPLEGATNVYLDTDHRRVYLVRPEQKDPRANRDYDPKDLPKEAPFWPKQ